MADEGNANIRGNIKTKTPREGTGEVGTKTVRRISTRVGVVLLGVIMVSVGRVVGVITAVMGEEGVGAAGLWDHCSVNQHGRLINRTRKMKNKFLKA